MGKTDSLPRKKVVEITTMCGHSLVSSKLTEHLIEKVKRKQMSSDAAAQILAGQCVCGIFNTDRASNLIQLTMTNIER